MLKWSLVMGYCSTFWLVAVVTMTAKRSGATSGLQHDDVLPLLVESAQGVLQSVRVVDPGQVGLQALLVGASWLKTAASWVEEQAQVGVGGGELVPMSSSCRCSSAGERAAVLLLPVQQGLLLPVRVP